MNNKNEPKQESPILQKMAEALSRQQHHDFDSAISIFNAILADSPNYPHALEGLGMVYAEQRKFSQAAVYLEKAVQVAPQIAEFHLNLGNAYKAIGDLDRALTHYREALRLKPTYAQAHNNLGALLYRIGKFAEAAEHFQKSLRMDPQAIDTHYNLANCYIQLDRLLDAASHYQEVLKLRPDHLGAMHNLGITFCALKRFHEAEPLLEQVVKREPNNIDAWFHLGILYSGSHFQKSQTAYEKVLVLDPNHGSAHHNLATLFLHLQQRDKALYHYQEAFRLQPSNQTAEHMIDALTGKTLKEGAPIEYTRALFDQYAYTYDTHVKNTLKYQVPHLLRAAMAPFSGKKQGPWTALDLGCGSGLCAPLFADIVDKMIGVDVSSNMIELARQQGGYEKLYATDILSFLENKTVEYDLIIAADVFVYFGALDTMFERCYRALKSSGYFCFSIEKLSLNEIKVQPELTAYQLRPTGRYAHHAEYIHALCKKFLFQITVETEETIRYQDGLPVEGIIYLLTKSAINRDT